MSAFRSYPYGPHETRAPEPQPGNARNSLVRTVKWTGPGLAVEWEAAAKTTTIYVGSGKVVLQTSSLVELVGVLLQAAEEQGATFPIVK